jgi:hypothetical protein
MNPRIFFVALYFLFHISFLNGQTTISFSEIGGISLSGAWEGSCNWGDYNNDGKIDLFVSGDGNSGAISKLYKNNGNETFTEVAGTPFTGVSNSSSAWGDYNNDGFIDLILCGQNANTTITKLYKNKGDGTFVEVINTGIDKVYSGSIAWGDYNNDGRLDVLIAGKLDANTLTTKVFKNNGNETFSQVSSTLTGITDGIAIWGDYNKDGYSDILISGRSSLTETALTTILYKNDSAKSFVAQSNYVFTGIEYSSAVWSDYDNNGTLDLFINGNDNLGKNIAKLYKNTGSNFVEQTNVLLSGAGYGAILCSDFNSDGLKDIVLSGMNGTDAVCKLYMNEGNNKFTETTTSGLPGAWESSLDIADFNNDGQPDIAISGYNNSGTRISKIFKNSNVYSNSAPSVPKIFNPKYSNGILELRWSMSSDDYTPSSGIVYNVLIKSASGAILTHYMSNIITGKRLLPTYQNAGSDTVFRIAFNGSGKHYFSVQAIDNAQNASSFAPIDSFPYSQTITFPAIPNAIYGSADIAPNASASSGLPIVYTSSDTLVAKIVSGRIQIKKSGVCTITANQSGNLINQPATSVSRSLTVNKGILFAIADSKTKVCNDDNPPLTVSYIGFKNNDNATNVSPPQISTIATKTSPTGKYNILLSGGSSANYSLSYINGYLTISPIKAKTKRIVMCKGSTFKMPNGKEISESGVYNDTIHSSGCDSINEYIIAVVIKDSIVKKASICEGNTYFAAGKDQAKSGIYYDTLRSIAGCDSLIIKTMLTVDPKAELTVVNKQTICAGSKLKLIASGKGNISWVGYLNDTIDVIPAKSTTYTAMAASVCGNVYKDAVVDVAAIPERPIVYASGNSLYTSSTGQFQWYEVFDGAIKNAASWSIQPTKTGDFYVITSVNNCSSEKSTSVHFQYIPTYISNENNTEPIQFYPNPFQSDLTVKSENEISKIEIINSLGVVCIGKNNIHSKFIKLNTVQLSKGLYFIKIWPLQNGQNPVVKKLLKE